jgi:hypothetical protein
MVADVLHYGHAPQETLVLSELVFEKTKGNPFFTISFLTKLYQTELIVSLPRVAPAPVATFWVRHLIMRRVTVYHSDSTTTKGTGNGICLGSRRWTIPTTWSSSWRRTFESCLRR